MGHTSSRPNLQKSRSDSSTIPELMRSRSDSSPLPKLQRSSSDSHVSTTQLLSKSKLEVKNPRRNGIPKVKLEDTEEELKTFNRWVTLYSPDYERDSEIVMSLIQ